MQEFAKGAIRIPDRGIGKTTEEKKAPAKKEEEKVKNVEISQPTKEVFEESSMQMGKLMLSGWTMLAEFCEGRQILFLDN